MVSAVVTEIFCRLVTTRASTVSRGEWLFLFHWDRPRNTVTRIITAITPKIRKKTISNPPPKKKLSIMPHASLSGGNAPVYVVLLYAPPGGNATNLRLRRE